MFLFMNLAFLTRFAETGEQRNSSRRKRPRFPPIILFLASSLITFSAFAQTEWLIFGDISATKRDLPPKLAGEMKDQEINPSFTLFGNVDKQRYRLLFEGVIEDEAVDIERLQLGWKLNQMNTLWFGRFHNPVDYWTSKYQHGLFFQTSQSRPGIVEFEDEGGMMPIHLSGFLFEGLYLTNGMAGISYTLTLAVGPRATTNRDGYTVLESPSVISPLEATYPHKPAISARLTYLPDAAGEQEIGLFIGRNNISTSDLSVVRSDVVQTSAGLFGNWENERYTVFGAAMFIRQEMDMRINGNDQEQAHLIRSQYIQGEYSFLHSLSGYLRFEDTQGIDDDAYIKSFSMFVKRRYVLGFRHEFSHHQAVKFEVSRAEHLHNSIDFSSISLQWNMMFP